jgi:hypothetical protein
MAEYPPSVKPPGRPRVDPQDASVQVCVTMSARQYDALATAARRTDRSVPEVIRQHLHRPRPVPGRDDPAR